MPEGWPAEWLQLWPKNIRTQNTPGVSCIFIILDKRTEETVLALQHRFVNDPSVAIHKKVSFPGTLTPDEETLTPRSYELLQIMQIDFFTSSQKVVFKTERLSTNGVHRAAGYYLEIQSKQGHVLWRFQIEHVYSSYTEWI
ncbi:MAG: hypothetical protein KA054_01945 [Candidatus Moranbacteria bacterium]|nr:hypothetical protein [Candidatus Moranbacteria bacterium]